MSTPTPTLNLDSIQGDVLQGLAKKFEIFLFGAITDATKFREQLRDIIPLITTTTQALADAQKIADHKAQGHSNYLKLVGTNIAFSQKGLDALGITDDLGDAIFKQGMLADASAGAQGLGDPGVVTGTSVDPDWDPRFKEEIDFLILITGDSTSTISERLHQIEKILAGSFKVIIQLEGVVRPGAEKGHEHFGFKDCLSQPRVTGFNTPNTGEVPTQPGVIIVGQTGDGVTRPDWAKDGSFLAFRQLKQLVPEFNKFLADNPIPDPGLTPEQGSELLGARLVGRWKSGAPIDRDPTADNPADAADPNKVNDFDYSDDLTAQTRCPFSAHLRKTNPRNGTIPVLQGVQTKRIMRQGMPYGQEVTEEEAQSQTTRHNRGLLFVCYQSNLANGFHFLQKTWANNAGFPIAGTGQDPLIGQNVNNPKTTTGLDPLNVASSLTSPLFVLPQGGEYFFSPSIAALNTTFAAN
ncbi:hypothetical protein PILCRDRAFT_57880 [Piloderma croceum F 1598]|uniref:Dyp-type peroxidase n=1 Tax=Piloderma croceum (strain F 1598) TaxID=765440 RepID=A0A0C3G509_PILCF|nr:hypothetical protein PILCRDRAFT_57880 [Piloderma croceum F 1598]